MFCLFVGCKHNWNSDDYTTYPKCPKAEPICNQETMLCQETPGSILLTKIVFTTKNCTGCNPRNDAVHLKLTGSEHMWSPHQCWVDPNGLHHPNETDFQAGYTTIFVTKDPRWHSYSRDASYGWGGCWKVKTEIVMHHSCQVK